MRARHSGSIETQGYLRYHINGRRIKAHVLIAEKALGKRLPKGAVVHHINKIKLDNRPENLLICPSQAYHLLMHVRGDAIDACGNPNWRRCRYCRKYDDTEALTTYTTKGNSEAWWHRSCGSEYQRQRRKVTAE